MPNENAYNFDDILGYQPWPDIVTIFSQPKRWNRVYYVTHSSRKLGHAASLAVTEWERGHTVLFCSDRTYTLCSNLKSKVAMIDKKLIRNIKC